MVSSNYNYQYIDWSHDAIPGEDFEHLGNLVTHLITPTITLGLSDYLNISYQQAIGIRSMDWMGSDDSDHHRDEDSLDSFLNAIGSAFGDASINLKYLLTNAGMGAGSRIFLGSGIIIPSNSVLTESPFKQDIDGTSLNEHRHFSMSDGCYKTNFELQYYIKRKTKNWFEPAFYGITLNYIKPLKESEYGYLPGATYIGVGSFLFATKSKKTWIPKGISLGFAYLNTEVAYWDDDEAPNSKTETIIPSIGMIWNHDKYGSFSLNLKYNNNEAILEDALNNESTSFEISLGYRKTLAYSIPWLYFN
tara:strand:- start:1473 stop:2387 length:915 start_codon:yes stop_codon:yes gene_type:complete